MILLGWQTPLLLDILPERIGIVLRGHYWRWRIGATGALRIGRACEVSAPVRTAVGDGFHADRSCRIHAHDSGEINIGDRVSISSNVIIGASCRGSIAIGDDVLIGPNVVLRASNHEFSSSDVPINRQGHTGGVICIGDDVWIGANSTVLCGSTIGSGSIIGAGSVVRGEIPPNSLAAGVPARVIREQIRG